MGYSILLTFKKEPDAKLVVFGSDVVSRMKGNARYQTEQDQVTAVETALLEFRQAVTNAMDGGHTLKKIRTERRVVLETELTKLARMLELHMDEDITFFTETGFLVRKRPSRHLGPFQRPVLKYLRQGVLSGSVDGESLHFPKPVKQIGIEYSTDGGLTWHNGTYSTGKRFTLSGLEPRIEYYVRISYQGTRQRISDWSDPLVLFVL